MLYCLNEMRKDEKTKAFIEEVIKIYKKYGLSISHEDSHGAFFIEKYNESELNNNAEWLRAAEERFYEPR